MNILQELRDELSKIAVKIESEEELSEKEIQILFIKSLIEEETGNGTAQG